MFKMTVWNRDFIPAGTITRPTAGELLDLGSRLQKDYGAVYKVEYVGEDFCPDCGRECRQCTT